MRPPRPTDDPEVCYGDPGCPEPHRIPLAPGVTFLPDAEGRYYAPIEVVSREDLLDRYNGRQELVQEKADRLYPDRRDGVV